MMTEPSKDQERALQELSAMTDGECEPGQLSAACEAWRRDASLRGSWHAYALIGDVMRSDDLASPAAHDSRFLQSLRARLADEPVVLAPAALPAQQPEPLMAESLQAQAQGSRRFASGAVRSAPRRRWAAPAAVAAGFVVVTGAMVVMRTTAPPSQGMASATTGGVQQATVSPREAPRLPDRDLPYVRDPQLDRYLNAHRQFMQGPALAGPGGIRQVAATPGAPGQ